MSHQPRNIIMLSVPQTLLQCIPESSGVSPFWYITLTSIYGPCFGQCCWRELLESIENWWLFFCLWFLFLSLLTSRFFLSSQPPPQTFSSPSWNDLRDQILLFLDSFSPFQFNLPIWDISTRKYNIEFIAPKCSPSFLNPTSYMWSLHFPTYWKGNLGILLYSSFHHALLTTCPIISKSSNSLKYIPFQPILSLA